jgi:hypothetical protein
MQKVLVFNPFHGLQESCLCDSMRDRMETNFGIFLGKWEIILNAKHTADTFSK